MGKPSLDDQVARSRAPARERGLTVGAGRVLRALESAYAAVSSVFLFCIMLIIVADVTMRYLFNSPLRWAFDVVSMYLMAGVFFLSLSDTLAHNGHVNVDVLHRRAPRGLQRVLDSVGCLLALLVFAGMAYKGWWTTWASYESGEVIAGAIAWPVWLSQVFVPLGTALLVLRLAISLLRGGRPLPGASAGGHGAPRTEEEF